MHYIWLYFQKHFKFKPTSNSRPASDTKRPASAAIQVQQRPDFAILRPCFYVFLSIIVWVLIKLKYYVSSPPVSLLILFTSLRDRDLLATMANLQVLILLPGTWGWAVQRKRAGRHGTSPGSAHIGIVDQAPQEPAPGGFHGDSKQVSISLAITAKFLL